MTQVVRDIIYIFIDYVNYDNLLENLIDMYQYDYCKRTNGEVIDSLDAKYKEEEYRYFIIEKFIKNNDVNSLIDSFSYITAKAEKDEIEKNVKSKEAKDIYYKLGDNNA